MTALWLLRRPQPRPRVIVIPTGAPSPIRRLLRRKAKRLHRRVHYIWTHDAPRDERLHVFYEGRYIGALYLAGVLENGAFECVYDFGG